MLPPKEVEIICTKIRDIDFRCRNYHKSLQISPSLSHKSWCFHDFLPNIIIHSCGFSPKTKQNFENSTCVVIKSYQTATLHVFRRVQRRRSTFARSVDTTRWRSGRSTAWVTTTMASSPARNGALPQRGNSLYQVSVTDGLMRGSLNGTHFGRIKVDAKSLKI